MSIQRNLEPFQVTKKSLFHILGSQKLALRMIHAQWILVTQKGKSGRECLYDYASVKQAYQRFRDGERPPLLPCEMRKGDK